MPKSRQTQIDGPQCAHERWRRRACRRLVIIRRAVKRFSALADRRAVQAESPRTSKRFRPLSEAEAEVLVGAAVAAGTMPGLHSTNIDSHGADP